MKQSLFKRKRIGEVISGLGYAPRETVENHARDAKSRLGEWLIACGVIHEEQLARALAVHFELPYADMGNSTVDDGLFEHCGINDAYRLGFVPYSFENGVLTVVISDPLDRKITEDTDRLFGGRVRFMIAPESAIKAALGRSETASRFLKTLTEGYAAAGQGGAKPSAEQISIDGMAGQGHSVEKFVNTILLVAMKKRASDIHLEAYASGVAVRYRIDGILYEATETIDTAHHRALITRLKVMAKLDIAENRIPQDGHFSLNTGGKETDFRVSILPSVFGEDVVIRILDKAAFETQMRELSLESLGFDDETLLRLKRSIREPYGMILITGPTGSGKTTTLYAALSGLNSKEEKIITIEDPVEYQIPGIVQVPVNEKKKVTFAAGLRSILRHDPDKIVVGEIRDPDTARIAVQSALTGHLVFTTVHANSACDVIGRFSHMDVNMQSFVSALNCVVAQRLLRNICPECKAEANPGPLDLGPDEMARKEIKGAVWYEGKGCRSCSGTGYSGRSAVAEFMELSPVLRSMIAGRASADELQKAAVKEGMVTLRRAALAKALKGETSLKEANRVTFMEGGKL